MNDYQKSFKLESVLNFRDVGGISLPGKKKIREGLIFRSANPDKISRRDNEKLSSLNIRTVIDLRAPGEVKSKKRTVDKAEVISLPLDFQKVTRERLKPIIYKKNAEEIIADISNGLYLEILDASAPVVKQVMEILASPSGYPLLIHCQAGKDRTGILTALILLTLGAGREEIIGDFMKSNDALLPFFKRVLLIRKLISFGFFPYRNMLFAVTVRQRNIESVLDRVEVHYGGIEGYLRSAGVDSSRLGELRKNLTGD
jgi:protein-tyrosine phosphatase